MPNVLMLGHSLHIASKQYCKNKCAWNIMQYTPINTTQVRIKKSLINGFSTSLNNAEQTERTHFLTHDM